MISHSEEETRKYGLQYAESLKPGDVIGLFGNLGSGKTQFVKGVCSYFNVNETINSPTFIIVNEYNGYSEKYKKLYVNHFDLYRIKNIKEFKEIGIESYVSNESICLFEWAELAEEYFKGNMKKVYFEHGENENERVVKVESGFSKGT